MRLALLESVLRLQCDPAVLHDFRCCAPRLDSKQQEEYETVLELYGSSRMLLAVLPQHVLQQVLGSADCCCQICGQTLQHLTLQITFMLRVTSGCGLLAQNRCSIYQLLTVHVPTGMRLNAIPPST